jgi:hypothetical protein
MNIQARAQVIIKEREEHNHESCVEGQRQIAHLREEGGARKERKHYE